MKGYKLYLVNYTYDSVVIENNKEVEKVKNYKVRQVLANLLCHPSLKIIGYEFYENGKLGDKILNCKEDYVTLNQKEYDQLRKVFDKIQGLGRIDAELVSRVYEAEQVEIKE